MPTTNSDDALARQAITDVIHRYCRAVDRIDAELGYTVWHEDGVAEYENLFRGTGHDFIDWVCEFHRGLERHFHQVSNILINVDGDRAASETYVTVSLLSAQDDKQILTRGHGRFVDQWSRRAGRWAIDKRTYLLDFAFTQPVDAETGRGRRDAGDASYAVLGPIGRAG